LPSLRERRDDIPLLAHHFLQKYAPLFKKNVRRLSDVVLSALDQYSWPGNVRELENVIQRAVVLSEGQTLEIANLPLALRGIVGAPAKESSEPETPGTPGTPKPYEQELRRFKRSLVLRTLHQCGWKKAESARALGVARGYLHRLINQLDIHEPEGHTEEVDRLSAARQLMRSGSGI
jgi:DNA-binding NtrC family response regulator